MVRLNAESLCCVPEADMIFNKYDHASVIIPIEELGCQMLKIAHLCVFPSLGIHHIPHEGFFFFFFLPVG